jgi:ketosteroid isomerase-like protein
MMHRPPARLLLAAAIAWLAISGAWAQISSEAQVRALEQRWLDNEGEPQVVQSILADDFVHVLSVGFINKTQHLEYLRQHPHAFPGKKRFEQLNVRVYGDTAVATGIISNDRGDGGAARRTAFTDVFVRRHAQWLAVNAQELPLSAVAAPAAP